MAECSHYAVPIQVMLRQTDRLLLLARFVNKDIVHKEECVLPSGIDDLAALPFFL